MEGDNCNPERLLEQQVCRQLQQDNPALTFLSWPFRGGNFATRFGQSMMGNTQLRSLKLANLVLSESEARVLGTGISQSKLKILEFAGLYLERRDEADESRIAKKILFDCIASSQTIQTIWLTDVPIEELDGFGQAISALPSSLRSLRVFANFYHSRGYGQLVSNILVGASTTSLVNLQLKNIYLGDDDDGFIALARGLHQNLSLTSLELTHCDISDTSVKLFVEHWHTDSLIQKLSLRGNVIGTTGAMLLLRAVTNHPAMKMMDLSYNFRIGYDGLQMIGRELPQLHLLDLNILCCADYIPYQNPSHEDAQAQEMARYEAGRALLAGMEQNIHITGFHVNNFCHPLVPLEFIKKLNFYTSLNKMGRRLLSSEDALAPTLWCEILAKCQRHRPFNTSLTYSFLCELPILVHPTRKRRRTSNN